MISNTTFNKQFFIIFLIFNLLILSLYGQNKYKDLSTEAAFTYPEKIEEFNPVFHFPPVNQDNTHICWSFSALSFIESEMQRFGRDKVKLSVNYPMYYAFILKAEYYVQTRGRSHFSAGDLFGTVIDVIKKYGIVPDKNFTGKISKENKYNHKALYKELYKYMSEVKDKSNWDEKIVVSNVKKILNKHIGTPPEKFSYKNKSYTPLEFAEKIIKLKWDDYIKITSFKNSPFFKYTSLNVPDNWRSDSTFLNIPIDLFYSSLKKAIKNNYSLAIDSDFSEPGRVGKTDLCFIPEYDISSESITQDAREFRFINKTTTDDHLMHIIGYKNISGNDWFLVKDSWFDAYEGKYKGYFFFSDDFIKLKVLAYLIHKDAIPKIINKLQ